ncbi:MAG: hypothetical protein IT381_29230 [Deltaproteobacteria bacterium]|nr:hypothetical protein [Deltaproteobacteria bacterium]
MTKTPVFLVGISAAALGVFTMSTTNTNAAEEAKAVNVTLTGRDQLAQWKGKKVTVVLRSGKELEGTVGEVTGANLELKQLGGGKDLFDAIVKSEEIAAILYRR